MNRVIAVLLLAGSVSGTALAQSTASETQRDVDQQQRIEQGLQSGQLSSKEAGQLEHKEQQIDRTEAHAMQDGTLSPAEKARIQYEQNQASRAIYRDKHNAVHGNPNSASSQRMQADVQRNVNQEKRVENGLQTGSLTKREAAHLERGQAHVDGAEAHAAADGHVGAGEQKRVQHAENHQSARIHRAKTNGTTAG